MNKIILLDENTISKIAAGEVIERPASVVKELVENSIDAGAKRIIVEVKDGGKRAIKISDDGCGMNSEDAKLSIERHSTSKIKSADDLFTIKTLGFRGEALASIASISMFELSTSEGSSGIQINVEGGKIKKETATGHPKGTTVLVEELFYNTPARLKFQKAKSTELSHIIDTVTRFILANPGIAFKLKSDGDEILSSLGSGKLVDSIASVYGVDMAKAMLEIKDQGKGVRVKGYITQPVVTKSDRNGESFIVNGRFVRNMLISKALEESYRTLIPNGKYPIVVLFIDIDPSAIDVNVHPTKREIKFAKPDEVMRPVSSAVAAALAEVGAQVEAKTYGGSWSVGQDSWKPEMIKIMEELPMTNNQYPINSQSPITNDQTTALMQLNLTYIVSIDGEDLILIDQHAAHERIMYEKIKGKKVSGTQNLLVPKTLELDPREFAILSANLSEIKELGFDIEVFGKNTLNIRGVPAVITMKNIDEAVSEILSDISESFKIKSIDERRESIWKMMACKAAVKAGDKLSYDEMQVLIKELKATSNPTTCPHGRPTMIRIFKSDLEKMFGR